MEGSEQQQREKEYSIQHFGFDPSILVQDIMEDSVETLTVSLGRLKEQIKIKKNGKFKEEELDRSIQELQTKYTEYFEDKFGIVASYFDDHIFKIPNHVLLKEDAAWDGLTQSVARSRLIASNSEMEKMREKYKNCLYKKSHLKNYLEKLKQVCTKQEETIQKEVSLKEKHGLSEGGDTLGFLATQGSVLNKKVKQLNQLSQGLRKRKGSGLQLSREKRRMLKSDLDQLQERLKQQQTQLKG